MRIGINGTGLVRFGDVERITADVKQAAADGFSSYWLAEHPTGGLDALTVLSLAAQSVPAIELGTAIVPTWPRHPMVLAAQSLTAAGTMDGRLTLGIGLSHASMLAEGLGLPMDRPILHLREYLSILVPLVSHGEVNFEGELLSCSAKVFRAPETPIPVLVAALGPQALRVTGRMADGTTLAWVGAKTVREHIVPTLCAAAEASGRPNPRVLATLPVCVTSEPQVILDHAHRSFAHYGELPSYQAMFEREGVEGARDLVVAGDESAVGRAIEELEAAGVTDFAASEFTRTDDERSRTRDLLRSLAT
jgi:F420-dependent oxidoreductase-like protein